MKFNALIFQRFVILFPLLLWAPLSVYGEPSLTRIAKYTQKGEKVAAIFCESKKLPSDKSGKKDIEALILDIEKSGACVKLSNSQIRTLAYYLKNGRIKISLNRIHVPHGEKCPVCGMFVHKYPKWAALIIEDGKEHYFDGVKDMMKFYIFDVDFPFDRTKIEKIKVTDFYSLASISAYEAFYVIGSDLFGPMGKELIPFSTQENAENFMRDHSGIRILRFSEITPKLVMALDGIELESE